MPEDVLYQRQALIRDLHIPPVASVVGVGGTGFWTAVFLAMSGVKHLILVDADTIEASNLNRLPLDGACIGMKKVEAARLFIERIRSSLHLELHDIRIVAPRDCTFLRGAVFCCTDNLRSQQLIRAYCSKNDILYQRVGYDGTILNVSQAFPLSFEDKPDDGGYTVTPSWVIPAAFAAAAGVSSILYKKICLMDDIGKVAIQGSSFITERIRDIVEEKGRQDILDNINEYIPDGYGNCDGCERGDCSDCDRPDEDGVEIIKQDARKAAYKKLIWQLRNDRILDMHMRAALIKWREGRHEEIEGEDEGAGEEGS